MNADRYSDFGFDFSLSLFPMSFGILVAFSFLLWGFSRHFTMIVEMYVVSFVFWFISFLRRFRTRRESLISSTGVLFSSLCSFFNSSVGILFNSSASCSFVHRRSVNRRIFFISGTRVCQRNSPVLQLMIGFCSCNQGKPRMILCFLRPVRNHRWV